MFKPCFLLLLLLYTVAQAALDGTEEMYKPGVPRDLVKKIAKHMGLQESIIILLTDEEMADLGVYKDQDINEDNKRMDKEIIAQLNIEDFEARFPKAKDGASAQQDLFAVLREKRLLWVNPLSRTFVKMVISAVKLFDNRFRRDVVELARKLIEQKKAEKLANSNDRIQNSRMCEFVNSFSNDDERMAAILGIYLSFTGIQFQQTQSVVQEVRWIVTLKNAIHLKKNFAIAKLLYLGDTYHKRNMDAFDLDSSWAPGALRC